MMLKAYIPNRLKSIMLYFYTSIVSVMYQNNFWFSVQEKVVIYYQLFLEIILLFQNIPQFFLPYSQNYAGIIDACLAIARFKQQMDASLKELKDS